MSSRYLFVPSGWIRSNAPLNNAVGRFVPQLARLTIKFCKERAGSEGVRHFIERDVVAFAAANPQTVVYLKPRRNRTPVLVAEYLNGNRHWQSLEKYSREDVGAWLDVVRTASGKEFQTQNKMEYTETPTVQGMWNSFTNANPSTAAATFPEERLSRPFPHEKTASERLRELFEKQGKPEKEESPKSREEQLQLEREKQH